MAYNQVRSSQPPSKLANLRCTTKNTSCTASSNVAFCTPRLRMQRHTYLKCSSYTWVSVGAIARPSDSEVALAARCDRVSLDAIAGESPADAESVTGSPN